MIWSFACSETEKIWDGIRSKAFPQDIQERALNKLRLINSAKTLNDLKIPPGNRLETLKGNRADQMSIRINDQWRICFVWDADGAYNVEIIDYH